MKGNNAVQEAGASLCECTSTCIGRREGLKVEACADRSADVGKYDSLPMAFFLFTLFLAHWPSP